MAIGNLVYTEVSGTPYADNVTTIDVDDGTVFPATPFEATVFNLRKNPGKGFNEGEAMIINVSDVTTNTLTFTPVTTQIALGSAIDWAVIVGVTKGVLDGKEDADATILKEADIVNDLTTGGTEVPASAETVKTLETNKPDHEVGTWTPIYTTSGTSFDSITYSASRFGIYVKIGRLVILTGRLITDAVTVGSASGVVQIGGLPFASEQNTAVVVATTTNFDTNFPNAGNTFGSLITLRMIYTNQNVVNIAPANLKTTSGSNDITFNVAYRVA